MLRFLLLSLFLALSLPSIKTSAASPAYKHEVAITAVFQNEARFLKEWIEYHRLVGVDHFFLYNNGSTDDFLQVLHPYIDQKIVHLINWKFTTLNVVKWNKIQKKIYNHSLSHFGRYVHWMAFIDADEFIVPVEVESLPLLLKDYENYGGLSIHWQLFGTSEISRIPDDRLLIETLTRQAEPFYWEHSHIKVIAQPSRIKKFGSSLCLPEYIIPHFQVNSDYLQTTGPLVHAPKIDKIRLNHYWSGDIEHLTHVKLPRWQEWYSLKEINRKLLRINCVEDETILKFVPELRLRMGS